MKMYSYEIIIGLITFNYLTGIVVCSVLLPSNGLVSAPSSSKSSLKPINSQVINHQPPSPLIKRPLSSSSSSYRSSISSLHHLPNHHRIPLTPVISSNQPHLSSDLARRLTSGLRAKLSPLIPFWSRNSSPKADKRALNLVRFKTQYQRGLPNAMALYNAILESHERKWQLDDPSLMYSHYGPPGPHGHPRAMMQSSERKVGKVVNRIMSNFIADCVGVVISEIFRKMGEIAGELARLVVSNAAQHIVGREELSLRSSHSSVLSSLSSSSSSSSSSILPLPRKTIGRIIQAIKPSSVKKTV